MADHTPKHPLYRLTCLTCGGFLYDEAVNLAYNCHLTHAQCRAYYSLPGVRCGRCCLDADGKYIPNQNSAATLILNAKIIAAGRASAVRHG